MSGSRFARSACESCGIHLEFACELIGSRVDYPGCGCATELGAIPLESTQPATDDDPKGMASADILGAFAGRVSHAPTSILYQVGLVFVTVAMVLLPLLYVAMVGAAAWAVYYWASHFTFLITSVHGGARFLLLKLVLYCGPLFAGAVLVFFMIKPLFARRAPRAQPLALNPGAEPLLYAFIAKVCETVGAPFPKRIDIDCQLNAAAGFRRGALSLPGNDLVLTIGLPLVGVLNLREFAGVLAHEFGHFTQSFGLRLSYLVRKVNAWFARVVYERDTWDLWLEELAETQESWTAIVVGLSRLAVWCSRRLLQLLMLLGHAISCFMLRQMEYDADLYEIKLAGSDVFETTTRRMHVFGRALEPAYKNMRVSWNLNRTLPENFPACLVHTESMLSPAQRQQLEDTMGLAPTGLLDTHPSKGDRIRRARQAVEPGVFHLDGPASVLFTCFEIPAKQVTLIHYADDLGINLMGARLAPAGTANETAGEVPPPTAANESADRSADSGIRLRVKGKPSA